MSIIKENFWTGVGTGDVTDRLHSLYQNENFNYALHKNLNAHNQFIQTFIAIGIVGFLLLIGLVVLPAVLALRNGEILFVSFLLISVLNFFAESVLEREAGIVWFSFFYSLFFCSVKPVKSLEQQEE